MANIKSPFYAYRYHVTYINKQTSIFQPAQQTKEALMCELISDLTSKLKTEWTLRKKRYLFYGWQTSGTVYILKFAKESNENVYLEGDIDIEIKSIKETKFVYVIIDTATQIILVERNVSIFQDIKSSVSIIESYFRSKMGNFDYSVNIYPLSSKMKFWQYVDSADQIFELSLTMNAPNMAFFSNNDIGKSLQQIKDLTNNEEFEFSIKSKEGKLSIPRETLGRWVDYVREVGGKYFLKYAINGLRESKSSDSDVIATNIICNKTEKFSEIELSDISEKFERIHTLEKRDEIEKS